MDHIRPVTLEAFCDGELPAERAREVEDHLRRCDACRREAETVRRVATAVRRARGLDPRRVNLETFADGVARESAGSRTRTPAWWQRFSLKWNVEWGLLQRGVAVAAVFLVLVGGGLLWRADFATKPKTPLPPAAWIEYIEPGPGADVTVLSDADSAVVLVSGGDTG